MRQNKYLKQSKHLIKLFGFAIALIIMLTVCPQQHAFALTESGTGAEIASIAFITRESDGEVPYWDGLDFGPNLEYAEEYQLMGDPGEYLSPAEAAKLTFYAVRDNGNIPEYSDNTEYTLTLVDLADIEGEECYVYRLDIENNDTLGAAYAYAYQSGNIYMQGQMGMWVPVANNLEAGEENARIGFITHEYLGDNIAEIPYIEYDSDRNPEIDSINRSLNQGIQQIYDEFMENAAENEWIEIKSYPFVSDEYLQVVVTYNIYPTYGTDGSMFSINYDKVSGKWVSVYDVLDAMGMDQEAVKDKVTELFVPETPSQYVGNVDAVGFLYREGPETEYAQLLLEITVENDEAEPWKSFYSYIPELDELLILNSFCLFDPYDMEWMDPPLIWQTYYGNNESTLRVEMDTTGFDEFVPGYEYMLDGMLYVTIQEFPSGDYSEDTVIERIKELEPADMRLITLTPSDNHSSRLSYPTWLVVFETGSNEDTSLCTDLYIQTNAGDFLVHTKVPADFATDYHDEIGRRLDTVMLTDAQ